MWQVGVAIKEEVDAMARVEQCDALLSKVRDKQELLEKTERRVAEAQKQAALAAPAKAKAKAGAAVDAEELQELVEQRDDLLTARAEMRAEQEKLKGEAPKKGGEAASPSKKEKEMLSKFSYARTEGGFYEPTDMLAAFRASVGAIAAGGGGSA